MRIGCSTYTPWQQLELPQGVVRFGSHSCSDDMGIVPSCGAAGGGVGGRYRSRTKLQVNERLRDRSTALFLQFAQDTPSAQPNHLLHATSDTLLRLEQMTVASRTRARHSVAFWVFPDYWSATVWR